MTQAIFSGDETVKISKAILLYGNDHRTSYATVHGISMNNKGMALAEGTPLTQAALVEIINSLSKSVQRTGLFLPENVLSVGVESVVWYVKPSESRRVWFNCNDKKIGERTAETPQPGLVFAAGVCGWKVFAVKGNERPNPKTQLFLPPHFNMYSDGRICVGSIDVPKSCTVENLARWESAYFDSASTHPNIHPPKKQVKYRGGIYNFWKTMLDGKFGTVFPDKVLVPADLTLADFINKTVGGGI